jgi:cysteine desulfuration protein SufE
MSLADRITRIKERFLGKSDWEERYKELIQLGKALPPLAEEGRLEKYLVKGCQSQVWLYPQFREGRVFFQADSDAILVKGIVALLLEVYSDCTPQEILKTPADFLKDIGITEHLSMNRSNGLASMLKQIQMYALVYQSLGERS